MTDPIPTQWPSVLIKDVTVNIQDLHPNLIDLLRILAYFHETLFKFPWVITSGNDGTHASNSLHYSNRAFDARSTDVPSNGKILFAMLVLFACERANAGAFYELQPGGGYHWHIELPVPK
jgi:hypothetical protein